MPDSTLIRFRQDLHRQAERSNRETATSERVSRWLEQHGADTVVRGLGGHGVAGVFSGAAPGPTVLLRCELDALPIAEDPALAHASLDPRTSHKCGHDGHMAIVAGVAQRFGAARPECGRVVLLFQPAEETGEGAARVLADPRFSALRPDYVLALHNLPGWPMGQVVLRGGAFACASRGMIVRLEGVTSHAAEPHLGRSPVAAAAAIATSLQSAPQRSSSIHECVQVTVVGLEVGGPEFGTSPGSGRVMATLRTHDEPAMARLVRYCESTSHSIAQAFELGCEIESTDVFPATHSDPRIVERVGTTAERLGLSVAHADTPFAWSEDFGHFTARFPGALFGLGSGPTQPPLHHPAYDFPNELLEIGPRLMTACARDLLVADARG